jgi:hypothetical protein
VTDTEYCSKVCKAKCCKKHGPIVLPNRCPKLTTANLCSIYETRIGFEFAGVVRRPNGQLEKVTCSCQPAEVFLKQLSPEVLAQCCVAHPELLNQ